MRNLAEAINRSVVKRRVSDRKFTDPWLNSRIGNASSCSWERQFTPNSHWVKQCNRCGGAA